MSGFKYPNDSLVTSVDADSFQEFIQTHDHAFIHFGATWNGYDKFLMPVVVDAATSLSDKVSFAALDVDLEGNFGLCREHRVTNVPYIEYYEHGKLLESYVGYNSTNKKAEEKIHPTTDLLQRLIDKFKNT